MAQAEGEYVQLSFFSLLPGSAGGRALRALCSEDYFATLAHTAAQNRTAQERQELAVKSAKERQRRRYYSPHTVSYIEAGFRVVERVVPWWPHQPNRQRRKRPIFVRIEIERCEISHEVIFSQA